MKKTVLIVTLLAMFAAAGCKKEVDKKKDDTSLAKKYAMYKLNVYQEKELQKILTLISKAESVDLLANEKVLINKKDVDVAKIKLSDDKVGYLKSEFLADKPVIFTESTKSYVRNNTTSDISDTIPRGTLGFITAEKGQWVQVFIGNYYNEKGEKKWLENKWVQGGFISDEKLVADARNYEESVRKINDVSTTVNDINNAKSSLEEMSKGSSLFAELAKEKLAELRLRQGNSPETDLSSEKISPEKARTVNSKGGLRMRDNPDQKSQIIVVIPEGEKVELLEVTGDEVTISGATGKWSKVRWKYKSGWVFGGFLTAK